jgi:integrase
MAVEMHDVIKPRLFMQYPTQLGKGGRAQWTPRLSRAFVDTLRKEVKEKGGRRWSDRTINRMVAHLKTFAKWIHKLRPFPLGNPTQKLRGLDVAGLLDVERALTETERRKVLDAADHLPVIGGRSRDRRRNRSAELPDERPRRKGYRPWRNRVIVYVLIETGMRRNEVTSIDYKGIDFERRTLPVIVKGGRQEAYSVSRQGMKAIKDYIDRERGKDAEIHAASPFLFLPASTVVNSRGRLTPAVINTAWNAVAELAHVRGKTCHSARHAMGVHLMKKTGNPRVVQCQLKHRNTSTTIQYMQFTHEETLEALDER